MSGQDASMPTICPAEERHVARICELAGELGYPCSPTEIRARLAWLTDPSAHQVLVAEVQGVGPIGWIYVFAQPRMLSEPRAEIGALIVDARFRGQGVGRLLVRHAERWAAERGCQVIGVRSNVARADAPAFYGSLGYETVKTQRVFRKQL